MSKDAKSKELYGIQITEEDRYLPIECQYRIDAWFIKPEGLYHKLTPKNNCVVLARDNLYPYTEADMKRLRSKVREQVRQIINELEFLH